MVETEFYMLFIRGPDHVGEGHRNGGGRVEYEAGLDGWTGLGRGFKPEYCVKRIN